MDLGTTVLFAVVALLALNQVVMRVPALQRRGGVFFTLIGAEILVGAAILVLGLPGLERVPAARWVVGLLFLAHAAQNLNVRTRMLREAGRARSEARQARVEAALAGRADADADDASDAP